MSSGPAGHVARSTVRPRGETGGRSPVRTFLRTADGVTIDAVYDPGATADDAAASPGSGPAFVIAHGFTGDADRPHVRRIAAAFARHGAVVTFSFRGHGASGGRSTVGDREVLDLAAAVAWARGLGHTRVVTVGFSMGGSVVLRHAALYGTGAGREHAARTDAVVSVSAPARWYYRGTAPMRRLHWLVTRPAGRLVGRYGFRTRIHPRQWAPVPLSPVEAARRIAPAPLLVVHGDRDGYFPVDHPRMLAEAAGDHGELWLEAGMGHAEHATGDELLGRIARWAAVRGG
ncbi:alpha/beta fold hydrolase [Streptomyces actuosus]|uniref:Alpha/beta fold hydrolase n=1 Tax=Streptomyces actuosus TaxID=1885 RepID=A0ABS2VPZ1_STRAS|nr:alpha/beta fold hydrolase [Streptomyces actuosus]MBN0045125.1 alpha/beta fold hydrolase [Streptomyces actuosus]